MKVFINQLSLAMPGIKTWEEFKPVLSGASSYTPESCSMDYNCTLLPPNERRRASETVKLVFTACEPIFRGLDANEPFESVFSSSGGDYKIFDKICRTLCTEERFVSPTLFHNSVFNAAAGYWGIATKNHGSSRSIAAADFSVGMGFIEALSLLNCGARSVLLCCYDICPPAPLNSVRQIDIPAAFAFYLSTKPSTQTVATIETFQLTSQASSVDFIPNHLHDLYTLNPMMTLLPLLHKIAVQESATVSIPCSKSQSMEIHLTCETL